MASHQRYFPVFATDGNDLLNHFITMTNYIGDNLENITRGNERVIRARLDDAIFFYTEDTKRSLESRVEDLKGVTFQKGLGTMHDKMNRIREIALIISKNLGHDKDIADKIARTAYLCKADLVTNLVREFTELQGIIGGDYAHHDNEPELVSRGISEHYMPVSAEGELASSITGQVTGIADKIDTICGVFALGKSPTGSADPLGLRRAALGTISTILKSELNINLSGIIENTVSAQPVKIADKDKLISDIKEFIIQRFRIYLNDINRYDVVEAVLNTKDPLADLKDVTKRIKTISNLVIIDNYNLFHEAANRVHRIIKSEIYNPVVNPDKFVHDSETNLWNCVNSINEKEISYQELVNKLDKCIPAIEKFFEDVLVMDPDMDVRQNRLALLGQLRDKFLTLADFSKIVL